MVGRSCDATCHLTNYPPNATPAKPLTERLPRSRHGMRSTAHVPVLNPALMLLTLQRATSKGANACTIIALTKTAGDQRRALRQPADRASASEQNHHSLRVASIRVDQIAVTTIDSHCPLLAHKNLPDPLRHCLACEVIMGLIKEIGIVGGFEVDFAGADASSSCFRNQPCRRINRA